MSGLEIYRSIFKHSLTPFLVLRPDAPSYTISDVNDACLKLIRKAREDVEGKGFFQAVREAGPATDPSVFQIISEVFDHVLRHKEPYKTGIQQACFSPEEDKKESFRFWNTETFPVFDQYGNVSHIVFSPTDITDIIQSEQSLALLGRRPEEGADRLISKYPDAIFTLDLNGNCINANDFACRLTELSKPELARLSFQSLVVKEEQEKVIYFLQKAGKGETHTFETRIATGKGNLKYLNLSCLPIAANRQTFGITLIAKDISTRVKVEQQLLEAEIALMHSEKRFKSLVQEGFEMIGIADKNGNLSYLSPSAKQACGYEVADLMSKDVFALVHPADLARVKRGFHRASTEYRVQIAPYRFRDPANKYRWFETTLTNLLNEPSVGGIVVNSRNISKRIEAQQLLNENVERYNIVSKATSDAIWDWDLSTGNLVWNKGLKGIFGYQEQKANRHEWKFKHIHPDDRERFLDNIRFHLQNKIGRLTLEYRFLCADGRYKHVLDRSFLLLSESSGEPLRMIGAMQDITDKKNKEQELEESLKKYELILNATQDAVYDWDLRSNRVQWNHSIASIFGYEDHSGNITVDWWYDKIHPADRSKSAALLDKAIRSGSGSFFREYRFRCSDGSYKYISESGSLVYDQDDQASRIIGAIKDIDRLARTSRENKRLADLIEKVDSAIVITDAKGKITWVNAAFCRLCDYTLEDVLGKKPGVLLQGPETDPEVINEMRQSLLENHSFTAELINYTKTGRKYWVRITCTAVFDDDKVLSGFISVQHEITERKEKEARIKHQTDLLKKVAWMSSHEIRRPVANILAAMELINLNTEASENQECLQILNQSAAELDQVVKEISHRINTYGL